MPYRPARRSSRRASPGGERGAVLVEAAIALPVLLLLLFGILEWGMAFKNVMTVGSATRSGARVGVAMPRNGNFDEAVVGSVHTAIDALSSATPLELWIYKAGANGYPEGRSDFGGCTTDRCLRYSWDGASFDPVPGYSWTAASQNACGLNADEMGVYLSVRHSFITGMFGSDRTLADHTVMRLEPIPATEPCGPAGS